MASRASRWIRGEDGGARAGPGDLDDVARAPPGVVSGLKAGGHGEVLTSGSRWTNCRLADRFQTMTTMGGGGDVHLVFVGGVHVGVPRVDGLHRAGMD